MVEVCLISYLAIINSGFYFARYFEMTKKKAYKWVTSLGPNVLGEECL